MGSTSVSISEQEVVELRLTKLACKGAVGHPWLTSKEQARHSPSPGAKHCTSEEKGSEGPVQDHQASRTFSEMRQKSGCPSVGEKYTSNSP